MNDHPVSWRVEQRLYDVLHSNYDLDPAILEPRIKGLLSRLSEDKAMGVLHDFEHTMRTKRETIRNPGGYLVGITQRVVAAADVHENERVIHELERLFREGRIHPDAIDDRCRDMLKHLPEDRALEALHELETTDLSTLKNIPSFFMGLMKKYSRPINHRRQEEWDHRGGDRINRMDPGAGVGYSGPGGAPFLPPPPRVLPLDLMYGFGDQEYVPEMPRMLEGTRLPLSVQDQLEALINRGVLYMEDIDGRVIQELAAMPEDFALTIAKEFTALDRDSVRNVPSYLLGIARRVAHNLELRGTDPVDRQRSLGPKRPLDYQQPFPGARDKRPRGGAVPVALPSTYMRHASEASARSRIDMEISRNVAAGVIRDCDIDDRVRDYLAAQNPWIASKAICDFCAKDMNRINNKSNFLKGIVRKLVEKEAQFASQGGSGAGPY
mmetsp:Transcript_9591/g.14439  ORF Transcript_9591/g.14439 Transcript_9591/m.14439 type:complete len:438 (+) Transcript_9591:28-1341(+)